MGATSPSAKRPAVRSLDTLPGNPSSQRKEHGSLVKGSSHSQASQEGSARDSVVHREGLEEEASFVIIFYELHRDCTFSLVTPGNPTYL